MSPRFRPTPALSLCLLLSPAAARAQPAMETFKNDIQPMLETYCYSCHGEGESEGGVTLDQFKDEASLKDHKLWLRVLKNTRSRIMPPVDEDYLSNAELAKFATFIKRDIFELNPAKPDPGRVTVRRLNRVDYRNTVRELMGVDFDTQKEFPADDTGHGFDNNGDVLTISPMLMEKYLDAAQAIVSGTVPTQPLVVAEKPVEGRQFVTLRMETPATLIADATTSAPAPAAPTVAYERPAPAIQGRSLVLSYYTPVTVEAVHKVEHAGRYQVELDLKALERYVDDQFDYNRCRLGFSIDGEQVLDEEFVREGYEKAFKFAFDREWTPGEHRLLVEIRPVGPDRDQKRSLRLRLDAVNVRGPFAPQHWVQPANYARYFPRPVPANAAERAVYLREILGSFATRAFRRPVDVGTIEKLAKLAERTAAQEDGTFEAGVAQAMVAVLASPRFIFREEHTLPLEPGQTHPLVDEWALASRLSYFLWSSMPDNELFRLAAQGRLRANLKSQVGRMLADPKSQEFVRNFTGQWLQARDITTVVINPLDVFLRENPNPDFMAAMERFRQIGRIPPDQRTPEQKAESEKLREGVVPVFRAPKPQLTWSLRQAMQQ
ncbi:MAG: hypothetical protein QG602_3847, partial [Verrucomicrobiota bacterium]|nr:hypothetical protein [Verrucomicrobiota bacterium]